MTRISIEEYEERQEAALEHIGNDAIWAMTPVTFAANGYPALVRHERQLLRFADPMKEYLSRNLSEQDQFFRLYSLRTRFARDEANLMLKVRERVADLCRDLLGRRIVPINSVVSAMGLFRVISAISQCYPGRQLSVLEIGPGSGYLGALLIEIGFAYASVDATQSFYLWQNRLYSYLDPQGFVEGAFVPMGAMLPIGRITHIPWWHYVAAAHDLPVKADIVVCEQALCEMHAWAMRYTLELAKHAMRDSDVKAFVFSGHGHPQNPVEDVERCFEAYGYERILSEKVYCYTPRGHVIPTAVYDLEKEIPLYNPSGSPELLAAHEFLKVVSGELPLDYEFRRFIGIWPGRRLFVFDP